MTLRLNGSTSGYSQIDAPAVAGDQTFTLPSAGGTIQTVGTSLTLDTAKTATGTSVDFTGIPSWVKRVTVILGGVSTSGTSHLLVQIGAGSIATTGYVSTSAAVNANTINSTGGVSSTAGFISFSPPAAEARYGHFGLTALSGNSWVASHNVGATASTSTYGGGSIALTGTLDRLRITTVNGTDTFDAGSINILYEG